MLPKYSAHSDRYALLRENGGYHFTESQQEEDTIRQHTIEQYGYHFMRFTNEEILFGIENVLAQIEKYFE